MIAIQILDNEYWYAAVSAAGDINPLHAQSDVHLPLQNNATLNQMTSLLLSNQGRYIYAEDGFEALVRNGNIQVLCDKIPVIEQYGDSLQSAYMGFMRRFDKVNGKPMDLDPFFVHRPVYNTWIELTFHQKQEDILQYAQSWLDHGFPAGTLIIDDGWSDYYGKWRFSKEKFNDAAYMIQKLKDMGFKVMLWVVPFISPDTQEYRTLLKKGCLLMQNGAAYALRWWNGISACLDMRKVEARQWMQEQLQALCDIGVDGFKFDGGDSVFYLPEHDPDTQSHLWASFAANYALNEMRTDFNTQGMPLMERLSDKQHIWGKGGVASLIPDTLALGLAGHPISSPDMIGGGEYTCFLDTSIEDLDTELILKNTAIAMLMPVVQFSVNLARVMPQFLPQVQELLSIRQSLQAEYDLLAQEAMHTKEPIVRYMEYVFPHSGMESINDQFMLGNKYLVAPLYKQGEQTRQVVLPKGLWKAQDGSICGSNDHNSIAESSALLAVYERLQ